MANTVGKYCWTTDRNNFNHCAGDYKSWFFCGVIKLNCIEKYIFSLTMNLCGSRAPAVLASAVGTPPLLLQQDVICWQLVLNDGEDVVFKETRLRAGTFQLHLVLLLALSEQSPDTVKRGADGRRMFGGCAVRRGKPLTSMSMSALFS